MARIFMDGFESGNPAYTNSVTRSGFYGSKWFWDGTASVNSTYGMDSSTATHSPLSTYCLRINNNASVTCLAYTDLPSTYTELYFRFYFYITNPGGNDYFFLLTDGGSNTLVNILTSGVVGRLILRRSTTTLATKDAAYSLNQWSLFEAHIISNATTGLVHAYIDGSEVFNFTGDTLATAMKRIIIGDATAAVTFYAKWDSFAVNDTTGSTNNSWIGPGVITSIKPKAAGYYTQWTPNTGVNYAAVDEVPKDDDTTYVWSNTVGQIDTYDLETLTGDKSIDPEATVMAISTNIVARYDTMAGNIAPVLRYSNVDSIGTSVAVGSSYNDIARNQVYDLSPFSNAAWTVTEVDGLEAGVKNMI